MKHSRFSSEQEREVESVANPQTPAELVIALLNPHSKVFKDSQNELMMNEIIQVMTEHRIAELADNLRLASKLEKDAIHKDIIARDLAEQEKAALIPPPKVRVFEDQLSLLDRDQLKQRLEDRASFITSMQEQNEKLSETLTSLKKESDQQTQEWKVETRKESNEFISKLAQGNIPLTLGNVDAQTPEGKKLIAAIFDTPAPATILDKVGSSWQKLNPPPADPSIPPPPPAPPAFMNAAAMTGMANMAREINLIGACANSTSGKDVLAAMKENKQARLLLPGANLSLKPAPGRPRSLEDEPTTTLFAKAIKNFTEKTLATHLLEQNKHRLAHEEALQEKDQAYFDDKFKLSPHQR